MNLPALLMASHFCLTIFMCGVLWIIQLVHYPMFQGLASDSFTVWHDFHSRRITWIVAPAMLGELFTGLALVSVNRTWLNIILLGLTIGIFLITFLISVPLHNSLATPQLSLDIRNATIDRLVLTNWWRTLLYSIKFLMILLFLAKSR